MASWLITHKSSCVKVGPLRFLITGVAVIGCCKECFSSGCSLKGSARLLRLLRGADDGRCSCFAIRGGPLGDGIFRGDHTGDPGGPGDPNEEVYIDEEDEAGVLRERERV